MTATYNPAEVERLVREAREEAVRRAATGNWNARAILLAMADQLEAARTRIAELEALERSRRDAWQQADQASARLGARVLELERELATLRASVVAALSSAGPEVAEDERTA